MELITVEQLATKKGCHKSYIYKLLDQRKLTGEKIGHLIVFNANSPQIREFLRP